MKIEKILEKLQTSATNGVGFQIGQYEAYALFAHVGLMTCMADAYTKLTDKPCDPDLCLREPTVHVQIVGRGDRTGVRPVAISELDELRNQLDMTVSERNSVLNENRTLIDENGMVKMQYSQCDKDRIAALKERDQASFNYNVQRDKVEACLREIKALTSERDRFKLQRDEFEKLNVVLGRDIKACESTYEDWRRQRDEARELAARYKSERDDARNENQRTTSAMIKVGNERDEARHEISVLRGMIQERDINIETLKSELGKAYGQNATLAQELDQSRIYESMAVGNIAGIANDRSDRIKRQEETIERLIKERDNAKACLEDVQIMLHSAVEQRDEALAKVENYQSEIKTTGNVLPPGCYNVRELGRTLKIGGTLYEVLDK